MDVNKIREDFFKSDVFDFDTVYNHNGDFRHQYVEYLENKIAEKKNNHVVKIVVIVDRSNGNESVGDMWKDTYLFDSSDTLENVIKRTHGEDFLQNGLSLANTVLQIGKE